MLAYTMVLKYKFTQQRWYFSRERYQFALCTVRALHVHVRSYYQIPDYAKTQNYHNTREGSVLSYLMYILKLNFKFQSFNQLSRLRIYKVFLSLYNECETGRMTIISFQTIAHSLLVISFSIHSSVIIQLKRVLQFLRNRCLTTRYVTPGRVYPAVYCYSMQRLYSPVKEPTFFIFSRL